MNTRIKIDHTMPEHEDAIKYIDDLVLRRKLQILGYETTPITLDDLKEWIKHRNNLEKCRHRLLFY